MLENITDDELEVLRKKAQKTALQSFGKSIYIRGLIELSSYCKNDCYYCGIRRSNKNAVRYRLSEEQILDCCKTGYGLGFRTFVLQGGDDPYYTDEVAARCMEEIFIPTMNAMNAEGRTFKGCLYFGLMVTADGPKVIEYNCRFGDPETQVVLPLLDSDLLTIMQAVTEERLADVEVKWKDGSACCVVAASDGYPVSYQKGYEIDIPDDVLPHVYVAGAALEDGELVTSGGRVLGVTAVAPTLAEAVEESYDMLDRIEFANKYYRADIGQRALKALK